MKYWLCRIFFIYGIPPAQVGFQIDASPDSLSDRLSLFSLWLAERFVRQTSSWKPFKVSVTLRHLGGEIIVRWVSYPKSFAFPDWSTNRKFSMILWNSTKRCLGIGWNEKFYTCSIDRIIRFGDEWLIIWLCPQFFWKYSIRLVTRG